MKKYLKLMRIHHYIKNGLIFTPLVFSGGLFNYNLLLKSLLGFLAFSLIASAIYIINDIQDVEQDRLHPTKCKRPLAANEISLTNAKVLAGVLIVVAIGINYFIAGNTIVAWVSLILYLVLNLAYSNGLKNLPIIDVAILVSGFVFRVLYGAGITGIEISNWLYLTVIAMSFYLGLGKRRNELIKQKNVSRKVLKYYNQGFLDKNMYMSLALTIAFYSLWTVDPVTIARLSNDYLVWTVPLVILICMKYSLNIEGDSDGDPVEVIIKDKILMGMVALFVFITLGIIYIW
ncbi:decaprenyl-phosphate phosphoribosyltransferase [Lysinibacillus capsici]|uniref:decaprenyl-phosphate phosphoribosyltransferase n=1 Tax=Lysinibacillus capsici TaxID=2115968 RepID=UPI0028BD6D27|nr:decaprenyl-phosphate phosphoribosyltransferase [Lysinibacillus capsici]MED3875806.1 decaprenyl-phosphate phosphoribosyltransferase [Lysinibacillus capsici]WNN76877.1 decaprenyl-phosphate phosphoribosyltransferase [Lysinibacillus capsici]